MFVNSDDLMFYESLTPEQKQKVEAKTTPAQGTMSKHGASKETILKLKCAVARELFGKKILKG